MQSGIYFELVEKGIIKEEEIPASIEGFEFYWEAFLDLGTDRPVGMGLAPIPFSSMIAYAQLYKIENVEEFVWLIKKMDEKYLEIKSEQAKKEELINGGTKTGKAHHSANANKRVPRY